MRKALILLLVVLVSVTNLFGGYTWVEGEKFSQEPNFIANPEDSSDKGYQVIAIGKKEWISDEKLLYILHAKNADKRIPEDGVVFGYTFNIKDSGEHSVWARIGFRVRTPFEWRIDNGSWRSVNNPDNCVDMEVPTDFNEIEWLKLATENLSSGKHTIDFRIKTPYTENKGKKKPDRVLFMLDAICFSDKPFYPNGKYKPNDDYKDEKDKKAAANVFKIDAGKDGERSEIRLDGLWEFARFDQVKDEITEENRLKGEDSLPDLQTANWYGIKVPADRNTTFSRMRYAHRYAYRTKVSIPAEAKDKGVFLTLDYFSMLATVFVNGVQCGWSKNFRAIWQCDITKAVKPGEINEIVVVIKDTYYSKYTDQTFENFNTPVERFNDFGHRGVDMPTWEGGRWHRSGLIDPVHLTICGNDAYTSDVFAKPSVKNKSLSLEVTLTNTTSKKRTLSITHEFIPYKDKGDSYSFKKPVSVTLNAGEGKMVEITEAWENPTLWWPDAPFQYYALTKISEDGKVVDIKKTKFGFREWIWNDPKEPRMLKLNGVVWPVWGDVLAIARGGEKFEDWAKRMKDANQNLVRYWGGDFGLSQREALDKADEAGLLVRRSGIFDGQRNGYTLTPEGVPNKALFNNWYEQLKAEVIGERNHPSIQIWSIENEITYINGFNTSDSTVAEPAIALGAKVVAEVDPTRPIMLDGGRVQEPASPYLPVNGCHYNDIGKWSSDRFGSVGAFPDFFYYARNYWYTHPQRDRWKMEPNRPIYHGEIFFAAGWRAAELSAFGGEECFKGMVAAGPTIGKYIRAMFEGFRWDGEVMGTHAWGTGTEESYNALSPVIVLCREYNNTFLGGSKTKRTLKVINETRYDSPIIMEWSLEVEGKKIAGETKEYKIEPGRRTEEIEVLIDIPKPNKPTAEGEFILTCQRDGKEVYRDVKKIRVFNNDLNPKPEIDAANLLVFDMGKTISPYMDKRGIKYTSINPNELKALAEKGNLTGRVLVVGRGSVPESRATDSLWYSLVGAGLKLVVLEQKTPLHYQAVPIDSDLPGFSGRLAFIQDLTHPIFANLAQEDFYTWSDDHFVYYNAYTKPSKGGRSLIHCDEELGYSALIEAKANEGLMLLSQLLIAKKIENDPAAQRTFDNMLAYAASYKRVRRKTSVVFNDSGDLRLKMLTSQGLNYSEEKDPIKAISGDYEIAVIEANPRNLKQLASSRKKLEEFTENGGYLMLWGLTPEGLDDYNKVVGYSHVIREFRREKVELTLPLDPIMSGLTLADVVMEGPKKIDVFAGLKWVDEEVFSYIIDYNDIAPFAEWPGGKPENWEELRDSGGWWYNIVNGLGRETHWRYCYPFDVEDGTPPKWTITLPREEELVELSFSINTMYYNIKTIKVWFDDTPTPFVLEVDENIEDNSRVDYKIEGKKAKKLTFEISDWYKTGDKAVLRLNYVEFKVKRNDEFLNNVKPLLNIGGLMRYNMGKGGIVLNQVKVLASEPNPINKEKKNTIVKAILENLDADYKGGAAVIAGAGLKYTPLAIDSGKARYNVYMTSQASGNPWFRNGSGKDMRALPAGKQKFADVLFETLDFSTSPVPAAFMLKGEGSRVNETAIEGIPVRNKADALFFLHTYNPSKEINRIESMDKKELSKKGVDPNPVLFKYVVKYSSGKTVDIPVKWKEDIGNWLENGEPSPYKNAAVAWSMDGVAVYSFQWNNPNPDDNIESIDMRLADDGEKWGAPALLGITAANAK